MWKNGKEGNTEGNTEVRRIMEGKDGRRLKRKKKTEPRKRGEMRHRCKGPRADIWQRYEAKHCSSLCLQSEGGEYCGGQARAENPTKSWPRALVMFATCSWPSLCEQSELQCWRRNRRLCGPVQISAARALPLTFDKTKYKRGVIEGYFITPLNFSLPVHY